MAANARGFSDQNWAKVELAQLKNWTRTELSRFAKGRNIFIDHNVFDIQSYEENRLLLLNVRYYKLCLTFKFF